MIIQTQTSIIADAELQSFVSNFPLSLQFKLGYLEPECQFDEYVSLKPELFRKIYDGVKTLLAAPPHGRSAANKLRDEQAISTIIANVLRSEQQDQPCHYSRMKASHPDISSCRPSWMSIRLIPEQVDRMTSAGLLDGNRTKAGSTRTRRSTFWATDLLLDHIARANVTLFDVDMHLETRPALILKDSEKRLIRFDLDGTLLDEDYHVRCINRHILAADIAIERDGRQYRYLPTPLKRIFNHSRFDMGGRYYGGNWQNESSDNRRLFRIGGKPVVELDYRGFMPRLLYHELDLEVSGDPYYVEAIYEAAESQGMDLGKLRDTIKIMFPLLLNSKGKNHFHVHKLTLPAGMSNKTAFTHLIDRHKPIEEFFFQKPSCRLMHKESLVCKDILDQAMNEHIVVLPVHDSFIVSVANEKWLEHQMTISYEKIIGKRSEIHKN